MSNKSVKNKSGIYKIVAICASVIASVTMTLPTITSAVGMVGTSRTSSAISGASATKASKSDARSAGADSGRASASSSATSTRSAASSSAGSRSSNSSTRSSEQSRSSSDGGWKELSGRNLKWRYGDKKDSINLYELHLSPVDKSQPVNGNHLLGQDYNGLEHIFSKYQSGATELANQIKTIVIDEDMDLSNAEGMFYDFEGVTKITGLQHMRFKGSNDVSLQSMFSKCIRLKELEGIQNWDISKVTNTSFMFTEDKNLKNIDLSGWKTNNKTNMFAMFYNSGVESLNLEKWNFSQDEFQVFYGRDKSRATAGMFYNSGLRDLTLPTDKKNENYSTFPDGIWRKSKGKSAVKPGENIDLVANDYTSNTGYIRWVRDYIKVTFNSKVGNAENPNNTITCITDALQSESHTLGESHTLDKNHTLSKNTEFVNCTHKYTPSKDLQLSGKPADKDADKEKLALQAEDLGLTYTAKLIRESKNSKIDVLENLLKEADNSRYKSIMTFDEIRKSLGIVDGDTVKWQGDYKPVFNKISSKQIDIGNNKKITTFIMNTGVQYKDNELFEPSMENNPVKYDKVEKAKIYSVFDVTFTADVKHKPKPKPPVPPTPPTPPTPEPQPQPQPGPSPTPSPAPTPTPNPDDHGVLPDVTPNPDLNINPDSTPDSNPFNPLDNVPQNAPQNPLQSNQGADVENNALRRGVANRNNRTNDANSGAQKQLNGNDGTCKCVCPTLPRDTKSHKSNKSTRKSENKATPCKSGNYSWLWNGGLIAGLIISWLIMLLIGFVLGYKMRKKHDEKQLVEE